MLVACCCAPLAGNRVYCTSIVVLFTPRHEVHTSTTGWQYDGCGSCTKMPSTRFCKGVTVTSLPCSEADGFIWVWPGEADPGQLPTFAQPPAGFEVHAEIEVWLGLRAIPTAMVVDAAHVCVCGV